MSLALNAVFMLYILYGWNIDFSLSEWIAHKLGSCIREDVFIQVKLWKETSIFFYLLQMLVMFRELLQAVVFKHEGAQALFKATQVLSLENLIRILIEFFKNYLFGCIRS